MQIGTGFKLVTPRDLDDVFPSTRAESEVHGVDVILDCTGVPQALEAAIKLTKRGAIVCVFGCAPVGKPMK